MDEVRKKQLWANSRNQCIQIWITILLLSSDLQDFVHKPAKNDIIHSWMIGLFEIGQRTTLRFSFTEAIASQCYVIISALVCNLLDKINFKNTAIP